MKILSNLNNYSFKSTDRKILSNNDGKTIVQNTNEYIPLEFNQVVYRNYTNFFRPDLNRCHSNKYWTNGTWGGFCQTIRDEFKNAPKVNVYDFACSDGSETYSLAVSLIEHLGKEEAQKYFPIYASDIDETIIKTAKSGKIAVFSDDIQRFRNNISNYSESNLYNFSNNDENNFFEASDELKSKIQFNQANIKDAVETIEPSNSIILCRNFWKYLSKADMYETIWKLAEKMDKSSILVIGDYDRFHTWTPLTACGFEEIHPLIFRKKY